jgi:hypothetical protein
MQRTTEWRTVGTVVESDAVNGQIVVMIALDQGDDGLHAHEVNREAAIGDFRLGDPLGVEVAPRFKGHQIRGYVQIVVHGAWAPGVAEANAARFRNQPFKVPA